MNIIHRLREKSAAALWTLMAGGVSLYFAYHLLLGERGIVVWVRARAELLAMRVEADRVRADLQRKANDVAMLSRKSLGPDHLDAAVRANLNYAAPTEYIIKTEPER